MGKDKGKKYKKEQKKGAEKRDEGTRPLNDYQNGGAAAAAAAVAPSGKGCICPLGCLIGKEILFNDVRDWRPATGNNNKFVKVVCTNAESGKCTLMPFVHDVCFDRWEEILMRQLRMRQYANDWNDDKLRRHLWRNDGGTFCHKSRKCSCGGFITLVLPEEEELPKPTEKAQRKAAKAAADPEAAAKKKLPTLVTSGVKLGAASVYKACPGYAASGLAASYASNDYVNRTNRVHNRQQREKEQEETMQRQPPQRGHPSWKSLVRTVASTGQSKPDDGDDDYFGFVRRMGHRSQNTSFSSMGDELNGFWDKPTSPIQQKFRRQSSASGTSAAGSALNGWKSESPMDFDDDTVDEIITEDELVGEIRDLLNSLGGQLDLDNQLLTSIVGSRSSGDLMLAICESGGLDVWLSMRPEFDVANGRVRVRIHAKNTLAHLENTGTVQTSTESDGIIYCDKYDCTIYFDKDVPGFLINGMLLEKGDIVKFEASECRPPVQGHRWRAMNMSLLQQAAQNLLTGLRRSWEDEEHPASSSLSNTAPVVKTTPFGLSAKPQVSESVPQVYTTKPPIFETAPPVAAEQPLPPKVESKPNRKLTLEELRAKLAARIAEMGPSAEDDEVDFPTALTRRDPSPKPLAYKAADDFWPSWSKPETLVNANGEGADQFDTAGDTFGYPAANIETKENGLIDSPVAADDMFRDYLPSASSYGESSAYADVLDMIKSWDI